MKTSVAIFAILLAMVTSIAIFWALQIRPEQERKRKIDLATKELQELEHAVVVYNLLHGYHSETLEYLSKLENFRDMPLIKESLLTDPWGRLYRYEPKNLHPKTNKPLIYTQGPDPTDRNSKTTNWDAFDKKK